MEEEERENKSDILGCHTNTVSIQTDVVTVTLLVLSAVNVIVILVYEVYIVCWSAKTTPSRRHLFLGQMLLLGLLLGSALGFAYAVEPSPGSSIAVRLGTGMAYVLIYSSLLVKLVFLISLNAGVYLPATYQALLFLFCVLVQIVIAVQWLSTVPPCDFNTKDHLLSLLYIVFLIIFVTSLAVKSRNIRDNYREGSFIGLLMVIKIPMWLAWVIGAIILPETYHNACMGFGLIGSCGVTFVIMFLPKSRQLTAMGREGVYIEDHEERLSVHSEERFETPTFHQYKRTTLPSPHFSKKDVRTDSPFHNGSYLGFHRPLRVVPPSSSPRNYHHSPHHSSHLSHNPPPPYPQFSHTSHFPSHFYPEKLYQYWHYYYPRIPGPYGRTDKEVFANLYEREKSKSPKPNIFLFKSPHRHSHHTYYH